MLHYIVAVYVCLVMCGEDLLALLISTKFLFHCKLRLLVSEAKLNASGWSSSAWSFKNPWASDVFGRIYWQGWHWSKKNFLSSQDWCPPALKEWSVLQSAFSLTRSSVTQQLSMVFCPAVTPSRTLEYIQCQEDRLHQITKKLVGKI